MVLRFRTSIYLERNLPHGFVRFRSRLFREEMSGLGEAGLSHLKSLVRRRREVRRIRFDRDYQELKRLNQIAAEQMSPDEWQNAEELALRVSSFEESYGVVNSSFFAAIAITFACEGLDRPQILAELQKEPWFVKHEVIARWGWLRAHQKLLAKGHPLERPFSFDVNQRGRHGRGVDREFYQSIDFLHGLRAHTGEELLFLDKGETPDFELETASGSSVGAEMTEAPVSRAWAAERDAEEVFLAALREVLGEQQIHLHVFEPPSWQGLKSRLPDVQTWLRQELQRWDSSRQTTRLYSEDLGLSMEASPLPHPAIITLSDERGLTGEDIAAGTLELEESIALAITGKLTKADGTPRKPPCIRPCHLVIYPNYDFGQDLEAAVEKFRTRAPIDVSSHFDYVWISDDRSIIPLIST